MGRVEDGATSSRLGASASTVGTAAIASARSRSLGGSCANASVIAGGRPGSSRAISVGESRSPSAKTMSMPSTRGCPWAMRRTSSASKCRGHGHCPYWARLFSSMSTIATRAESLTRGHTFSTKSKPRTRNSVMTPGSMMRSARALATSASAAARPGPRSRAALQPTAGSRVTTPILARHRPRSPRPCGRAG